MNCLIRIRQRYPGFAQSDKKLADYLLINPIPPDTSVHSNWPPKRASASRA